MRAILQPDCRPETRKENIVQGPNYRISILTESLFRLEYSAEGVFTDRPTQLVMNRDFPASRFRVFDSAERLEIVSDYLRLQYDKRPFSRNGLILQVRGGHSDHKSTWRYGESYTDLKGTVRTLDEVNGRTELGPGLLSKQGFSVIDDSHSLLLREDGWIERRPADTLDIYFFGCGRDYKKCLRDFYYLCGRTPLLPRYALGNWWSRYHAYDEAEYLSLMAKFKEKKVPLSVAVIDMDWHLTDIDPKYGSGWTGYTWNRELFPDPERFMRKLHEEGLKVSLNVHPAEGVQPHEEQYVEMAKALHKDYENEENIPFDFTDPDFVEAYFKYLHHPNEEMGVDFWWIDWQQGSVSDIPGLDPLWMLNHYHYLDSGRRGRRRLTFSRYAGIGSHRYPIGFSGDTHISWESLDFQPYFTATASNVGYGWWSHDIGGHFKGEKDDELACRWLQFGTFSPINRLHSSKNPFGGKEPWNYNKIVEENMIRFMQLRHELIPYIYTMNRKASREGLPLIRPMYYEEPQNELTYHVPNEYYFGDDFIACPITQAVDKKAQTASFTAWIPEGQWIDFFNGRLYEGGCRKKLYRGLDAFPLLVRSGSLIPLADLTAMKNSVENPKAFKVKIFAGADGAFDLWEDDGDSLEDKDENWCLSRLCLRWGRRPEFVWPAAEGNKAVIPPERDYRLMFVNVPEQEIRAEIDGVPFEAVCSYEQESRTLTAEVKGVPVSSDLKLILSSDAVISEPKEEACFRFLDQAQIADLQKLSIYELIKREKGSGRLAAWLNTMDLEPNVMGTLLDIITADE